jgi:hypothetical protein
MQQLGSHRMDFYEIWYLSIFLKTVKKIHVSLKSDKNNSYFIWRLLDFFLSYLTQFFLEWEMFHTIVVVQINTHILYSITFFFNCAVYDVINGTTFKTKKKCGKTL